MNHNRLALGILDTSQQIGDPYAAAFFRDKTLSWSRYGYREEIFEGKSLAEIAAAATATAAGFRYCVVIPYGAVPTEQWRIQAAGSGDFFTSLMRWIERQQFSMGGTPNVTDGSFPIGGGCIVFDLHQFQQLRASDIASPDFDLPHAGDHVGLPFRLLDEDAQSQLLDLQPTCTLRRDVILRYAGGNITSFDSESCQRAGELSEEQIAFLQAVSTQASRARRGVFLWNIESYADIEAPIDDFNGPVSTLYSVAAGFKPNRILQTHGFSNDTKVVYFDYSRQALDVRRFIVEHWDGDDFPDFVSDIFQAFPAPDTYYQLWDNATPQTVPWDDIHRVWQLELQCWGGSRALQQHWRGYRQLQHEYVPCDLLTGAFELVDRLTDESSAVIWWSNAFFTMYGNWLYPADHRERTYRRWMEQLAVRCPQLNLYGSDVGNACVNGLRAAEYWDEYRQFDGNGLQTRRLCRTEIRM
ncbi:MAG: hypothetical protein R3E01_25865 [Pirellulaceae bacterium]